MPVGVPPKGGPLGRSRSRLSASGLTSYLRCPRQWYLTRKVGLSSPSSIGQVTGLVVEDALCRVLMNRPGPMDSMDELRTWAYELCKEEAKKAWQEGENAWNARLWKRDESDWSTVEVENYEQKIRHGVDLFLEEVEACFNQNGGPFVEQYRSETPPFNVPSPAWGETPLFPVPEKVRSLQARDWSMDHPFKWQEKSAAIRWDEAWEIARPWFKDPRVHQPQRMFHPEGWAAGELDLVLRWDGRIRLYNAQSQELPVGLFTYVTNFAAKRNYLVETNKTNYGSPWDVDDISDATLQSHIRNLNLPYEVRDYQYEAIKKAQGCAQVVYERLKKLGHSPHRWYYECLGSGDSVPGVFPEVELFETVLRIAIADPKRETIDAFTKEIAPLVTSGPQGVTGYLSGRPKIRPIFCFWPCLIPKKYVSVNVEVLS